MVGLVHSFPPLNVRVVTPCLELRGATDELLERLVPVVRAGRAMAEPAPFDDPMSLYESDPDTRVQRWLQAVWRGRATARPELWRLCLVVVVDGEPVGVQDVIGDQVPVFGAVTSFSWLSSDVRGRGLGAEMRAAVNHLAFAGLGVQEAHSEAFVDNDASNRVSHRLGYEENGTIWATRRGTPARLRRWRLTRDAWLPRRRDDIALYGVRECASMLDLPLRT